MQTKRYSQNAATTAALIEAGFDMMRQTIRRRHADAKEEEIAKLMQNWALRSDASLPGDTAGPFQVRYQS